MEWLDKPIRIAYRILYPLALVCWRLTKRPSYGVQVALWLDSRVLLVKNSYRNGYAFPGGDLKAGERPVDAASRELKEETNIAVSPKQLSLAMEIEYENHGKSLRDEIFECTIASNPNLQIDNREVVEADFFRPEDALDLCLLQSTRKYLLKRNAARRPSGFSR